LAGDGGGGGTLKKKKGRKFTQTSKDETTKYANPRILLVMAKGKICGKPK